MNKKFKDYYATLGIGRNATEQELKSAFRRLAKESHPDRNPGKNSEERFKEINDAYEILSDSRKKPAYDREYDLHASNPIGESDLFKSVFGEFFSRKQSEDPFSFAENIVLNSVFKGPFHRHSENVKTQSHEFHKEIRIVNGRVVYVNVSKEAHTNPESVDVVVNWENNSHLNINSVGSKLEFDVWNVNSAWFKGFGQSPRIDIMGRVEVPNFYGKISLPESDSKLYVKKVGGSLEGRIADSGRLDLVGASVELTLKGDISVEIRNFAGNFHAEGFDNYNSLFVPQGNPRPSKNLTITGVGSTIYLKHEK